MKGQVIAEFLAEIPQQEIELDGSDWWTLNMDVTSRQTGTDLGLQHKASTKQIIEQAICLDLSASNNEVEYEAIIASIDFAISVSSEKNSHKKRFSIGGRASK